jgi:hypothetical protein
MIMQPPILPMHPPHRLERPCSLERAVSQVISNPVGRQAGRFEALTQGHTGPELVRIISNLIVNAEAVEFRERELRQFPYLLTIEDFVGRFGSDWDFEPRVIQQASALSEYYDRIAFPDDRGRHRYEFYS